MLMTYGFQWFFFFFFSIDIVKGERHPRFSNTNNNNKREIISILFSNIYYLIERFNISRITLQ
jgi:hypothetical protein